MAKAYETIADKLREQIRAGQFRPGDRLPSEADLIESSGRSGPTVQQALRVLQAEGLIEKRHGVGTFVRRPRTLVQRDNARHQWEKSRAHEPETKRLETGSTEHDTGLEVNDLVFHASYRETEAPKEISDAMGVAEGTPLVERSYRTRYGAERSPFTLVTSYLVRSLVESNPDLLDDTKEPWPGGTMNQLSTVGIEIDRVEERVTARPPASEEAEELGLPPGTAVLVLRKTSYDIEGRAVEMSDVILPGDRTEMLFTTHLERW
ncbi:GntR family transcriptional regulator [Streptomyces kanamyceticus]|uniref:GntR family transcriptional regulator n=1 Tax=Streptomyces kanamyceticus TaxID=1967 RepID=A0A5J6GD66_STRKN|nr:GntR family transcriptional regulator [Streptomyces kanamyceticus]QEU93113.1 GntR family transcriptional regulator [Streptomyces kanamyceticus]